MNGLDCAKCQKSRKVTHGELMESLMIIRQKQIVIFFSKRKETKTCSGWNFGP